MAQWPEQDQLLAGRLREVEAITGGSRGTTELELRASNGHARRLLRQEPGIVA
jgi:hypothetical protein